MSRSIDHLVWAVKDLAAGRHFMEQLGFQSAPLGVHPFGTGNHNVFFDQSFLEVLSVLDAKKIIPADAANAFSFSDFNATYLQKREGISMMVVNTPDARKDEVTLKKAGWQTYPSFHFSRPNVLPDGQTVEVAFTSTFCTHPLLPDLAFFVCQHHHPQYIWHEQYRQHQNQIKGIAEVHLVCESPSLVLPLFQALFDCQQISKQEGRLSLHTGKEIIHLVKMETFRDTHVIESDQTLIPSIAAIDFELETEVWEKLILRLQKNKTPFQKNTQDFQLTSTNAFGCHLKVNRLNHKA